MPNQHILEWQLLVQHHETTMCFSGSLSDCPSRSTFLTPSLLSPPLKTPPNYAPLYCCVLFQSAQAGIGIRIGALACSMALSNRRLWLKYSPSAWPPSFLELCWKLSVFLLSPPFTSVHKCSPFCSRVFLLHLWRYSLPAPAFPLYP